MKSDIWNEVVKEIVSCPFNQNKCLDHLLTLECVKVWRIGRDTLVSIINQQYQKTIKTRHHMVHKEERVNTIYVQYLKEVNDEAKDFSFTSFGRQSCGTIVRIAEQVSFSPWSIARMIVKKHLKMKENVDNSLMMKILNCEVNLDNPRLQVEVSMAALADTVHGPYADSIKTNVGEQYELKLKQSLIELGISFQDEDEMKCKGYDKTPDIKLDVPIAVNGRSVNWIESKALFGDLNLHRTYLRDQLWSYWNRFGSGLVIYWFGFIDEINESKKYAGILVADNLSADTSTITLFDPLHDLHSFKDALLADLIDNTEQKSEKQHQRSKMTKDSLKLAVVCASNMNRSMEAHLALKKRGYDVDSYGTGDVVKIPGPSQNQPNVYDFGVTYDHIYQDLVAKDKPLYTQNGLLHMLDRNRRIKKAPIRLQDATDQYDLILTAEERVYDKTVDHFEVGGNVKGQPVHVINIDIEDNHEEATLGAFLFCQLVDMIAKSQDVDDEIEEIVQQFEDNTGRSTLHTVCFY